MNANRFTDNMLTFPLLIGLLRRCFSQQCEVRVAAYHGLGSLSENYAALSGDVFEILYTQVGIKSFPLWYCIALNYFVLFSSFEPLKRTMVW
jgi:hypothetical protein